MISFRYQIHLENVVPAKLHHHFYLLTYLLTYLSSLGGDYTGVYYVLFLDTICQIVSVVEKR